MMRKGLHRIKQRLIAVEPFTVHPRRRDFVEALFVLNEVTVDGVVAVSDG